MVLGCIKGLFSHFLQFLGTAKLEDFRNLCKIAQILYYSKTCAKHPLSKRPKIGFQVQLSLNAGQIYCRMLQMEHSAILLTFIKLPIVIKIFVLSILEWPFYTGFTVCTLFYFQGTSTAKDFYKKNHRWTEGFISAAKAVGWGATTLM